MLTLCDFSFFLSILGLVVGVATDWFAWAVKSVRWKKSEPLTTWRVKSWTWWSWWQRWTMGPTGKWQLTCRILLSHVTRRHRGTRRRPGQTAPPERRYESYFLIKNRERGYGIRSVVSRLTVLRGYSTSDVLTHGIVWLPTIRCKTFSSGTTY